MTRRPVNSKMVKQLFALLLLVTVAFIPSVANVAKMQFGAGKSYVKYAKQVRVADSVLTPQRGSIYDAGGNVLAQSAPAWRLYAVVSKIKSEELAMALAQRLSAALNLDRTELYDKIKPDSTATAEEREDQDDLSIKRRLTVDEYSAVKALMEQELVKRDNSKVRYADVLYLVPDSIRYYPNKTMANVVLGYVDYDNKGASGVEYWYNKQLTGTAGRSIYLKDAQGRNISSEDQVLFEAKDGNDIYLTLDENIQGYLESALAEAYDATKCVRAYGIVMDVKTGAVLAMGVKQDGSPDPNNPTVVTGEKTLEEIKQEKTEEARLAAEKKKLLEQWRNPLVASSYEPGSVFKIVTASAAIEEKTYPLDKLYNCKGYITVGNPNRDGRNFWCHKESGHGWEDMTTAFVNSCNPCFVTIGQSLGVHKFFRYFEAFGFTEKTGIDLNGEVEPKPGISYHAEDEMNLIELSSCSFGQSFQLSPIQIITAVSAIGNGGKLMRPYIVAEIRDSAGTLVSKTEPFMVRQAVSASTAKTVTGMMKRVVSAGSGENAYIAGYSVAGKTGTSEKLLAEGAKKDAYVASFACFAPGDDPKVAVLIAVDEPEGLTGGGQVAAPYAGRVMENTLRYLNVEPKYSQAEEKRLEKAAPPLAGLTTDQARQRLESLGYGCVVYGDGENVVSQNPPEGAKLPAGSAVAVFTDAASRAVKAEIPDFRGLSLGNAKILARDSGLNIRISGTDEIAGDLFSYSQDLEAGVTVIRGTVVTVYFKTTFGASTVRD